MKKISITPQELCERLFKGESFYGERGFRLSYNKRKSCFEEHSTEGDLVEMSSINYWLKNDIYTKPHWTDNLSEESPVLCWVEMSRGKMLIMVKGLDSSFYVDTFNNKWANAEPVKLSEACIWSEND